MLFFERLLKLPTPKDLGWSAGNALGMRFFGIDEPDQKTWEDYEEYIEKNYPVKNFFANTLPAFIKYKLWYRIYVPVKNARYWLVSHVVPSRRYHMLDLRQPHKIGDVDNVDSYQYGWLDVPEKMLYAMFNLLGEYITKERPYNLREDYTDEQIESDVVLKRQQHDFDEAHAIHKWWTVERNEEIRALNEMTGKWHDARKKREPGYDELWEQLHKMKEDFESKTDSMISRLMLIRRGLWT